MWWASVLPVLGFLDLSVLEVGRGTRETDRWTDDGQTDTAHHFVMPPPYGGQDIKNYNGLTSDLETSVN